MRFCLCLLSFLFLATAIHAELVAPNGAKRLENYRTSWLGNSFGGLDPETGKGQWVQQDIAAMHVCADGTVYTNVPWEEAGGNCSMYKDGKMLGSAGHTHGWGFNGGKAVAANDKYVFIALRGNCEGGGLKDPDTWPPKGFDWHGVSRRLKNDFTKGAPFEHGKGGKGDTLPKSFLVVNEVPIEKTETGYITGLWATEEKLYVSNPLKNRIEIYDTETMKKTGEWAVPKKYKGKLRQIAMDPDGNLWVLVNRPYKSKLVERFLVFDREGRLLARQNALEETVHCPIEMLKKESKRGVFDDLFIPSAFCFDNKGRLLIADGEMHQAIIIFEKDGENYRKTDSQIGWSSWTVASGSYGDMVFSNIKAIGCDASGNIYVADDWATNGGGTILESYAPTVEPNEMTPTVLYSNAKIDLAVKESMKHWKLNWRLFGLCFIDCATLDPDDETFAYTKEDRYKIDWSREPGKEAVFLGSTTLWLGSQANERPVFDFRHKIGDSGPVWVRNLDRKKFLFVGDMNSVRLQVYRLDSDLYGHPVYPVALFSPQRFLKRDRSGPVDWLPNQPEKGEWIWSNSQQGFGTIGTKPEEFLSQEREAPRIEGWCIERNGDIWQATLDKGLRRFLYQGLDRIDNPIWNFENMDVFPHPAEFTQVKRIRYDAKTDTLYLGGCAMVDGVEYKNQHWKPMGPVVCRYDHFLANSLGASIIREKREDNDSRERDSGGLHPRLGWKIVLPYVKGSKGHESCEPMGFDIAGDYMFVPYTGSSKEHGVKHGRVEVYRLSDGTPVGWMEPDPKTVGEIGLQDMRECLSAHRLKSGEYVIFLKDDYKAKVVMYRVMLP